MKKNIRIEEEKSRIAVVDKEKCKPLKCAHECKRICPVNRGGKECIEIKEVSIISEALCIGCGLCVKKCPFNAITIFNIPTNLTKDTTHRFGPNSFKLHRLPVPKPGKVLGLVGTNGIGKSTALKILSGKVRPNFGDYGTTLDWIEVAKRFKGSELQGYFMKIADENLITSNKIQYIDKIPRHLKKQFEADTLTVKEVITKYDQKGEQDYFIQTFDLHNILTRDLDDLSGGELQRFAIAVASMKKADVYIFDEPTSFLDVRQRLNAAKEIRKLVDYRNSDKYAIVVEHDMAILDLLSDFGCVLYGESGVYGVISAPYAIKQAINNFLDGYIPTENMRFRQTELKFNIPQLDEDIKVDKKQFNYEGCIKTFAENDGKPGFTLQVAEGYFSNSEITVLFGENGMGKSTFAHLMAGLIKSDSGEPIIETSKVVSIKQQKIVPRYKGTVRNLLEAKIGGKLQDQTFNVEVIRPLCIEHLLDNEIASLSGGELQRIAIILCLGKDADIYLFDEPAAFLDCDQRIAISKIIKRYIYGKNRAGFVIEHDLVVATYLADKILVFEGQPGINAMCSAPLDIKSGMNRFLKNLDVTFRRDPTNYRPRVNKPDSSKDREQKKLDEYFFV